MDDLIKFILENGIPEKISEEPVYGMLRRLAVKYTTLDGQVMIETVIYANPADSDGWAQELRREFTYIELI